MSNVTFNVELVNRYIVDNSNSQVPVNGAPGDMPKITVDGPTVEKAADDTATSYGIKIKCATPTKVLHPEQGSSIENVALSTRVREAVTSDNVRKGVLGTIIIGGAAAAAYASYVHRQAIANFVTQGAAKALSFGKALIPSSKVLIPFLQYGAAAIAIAGMVYFGKLIYDTTRAAQESNKQNDDFKQKLKSTNSRNQGASKITNSRRSSCVLTRNVSPTAKGDPFPAIQQEFSNTNAEALKTSKANNIKKTSSAITSTAEKSKLKTSNVKENTLTETAANKNTAKLPSRTISSFTNVPVPPFPVGKPQINPKDLEDDTTTTDSDYSYSYSYSDEFDEESWLNNKNIPTNPRGKIELVNVPHVNEALTKSNESTIVIKPHTDDLGKKTTEKINAKTLVSASESTKVEKTKNDILDAPQFGEGVHIAILAKDAALRTQTAEQVDKMLEKVPHTQWTEANVNFTTISPERPSDKNVKEEAAKKSPKTKLEALTPKQSPAVRHSPRLAAKGHN